MKSIIFVLWAAACFGQTQNVIWNGFVDARGLAWLAPAKTYAQIQALTASAHTNEVYVATDCATTACTAGGGDGTVNAQFRSNGTSWLLLSGAGSGSSTDTAVFASGTVVQRKVQCATGTVPYTSLTAAAASQEITIETGISGNVRYDQALISETTQFASTTGLTVSMGRPGSSTNSEITGVPVALMQSSGDANFWSTRPLPPQLGSTYSLVLNFQTTSGNVNAATAGVLTWEVCGYAAR